MFETNDWSDDGVSLMLIGLNTAWFLGLVCSMVWNWRAMRKAPKGEEGGAKPPMTYEEAMQVIVKRDRENSELKREVGELGRKNALLEKKSDSSASTPGKKTIEARFASRVPTSRV